jgi:transmembrane sensor
MSGDTRKFVPEDLDTTAAKWIGRLDSGLTPEEEVELGRWRAADRRNEAAFARFRATWCALGRARRTGGAPELNRQLTALTRKQRRRRFAIAGASLAILMAAAVSWWASGALLLPARSSTQPMVLLIPERRALPDGSTIEYRSGTVFSVDYSGELRRVVLRDGEALFEVAKNPERAFVVDAAGVEVRALGTAFSVQISQETVDVLVTEGSVRVEPRRPAIGGNARESAPNLEPDAAILTVGQKTIVPLTTTGPAVVTSVEPDEVAKRLAWRNPRVEFSGAPFSAVVAVMNRHNRIQFVIDDASLDQVPMSGLFRADDPETFVRMLEAGFGVKAERATSGQVLLRKAP